MFFYWGKMARANYLKKSYIYENYINIFTHGFTQEIINIEFSLIHYYANIYHLLPFWTGLDHFFKFFHIILV